MELKKESITVALTNEAEADREYTIRADVRVKDGVFAGAYSGQVMKPDTVSNGMAVVYFNAEPNGALSVTYRDSSMDDTDRVAVLNLINGFLTSAKAKVETITE